MKDLLISVLETFGYPVFQQGSLERNAPYPDSFFTFWNNSVDGKAFYDNKEHFFAWNFDVNFYSNNPDLVNQKLLDAKCELRKNGFIITGKGYEVSSDYPTHTGRGINAIKIEIEEDKHAKRD